MCSQHGPSERLRVKPEEEKWAGACSLVIMTGIINLIEFRITREDRPRGMVVRDYLVFVN